MLKGNLFDKDVLNLPLLSKRPIISPVRQTSPRFLLIPPDTKLKGPLVKKRSRRKSLAIPQVQFAREITEKEAKLIPLSEL